MRTFLTSKIRRTLEKSSTQTKTENRTLILSDACRKRLQEITKAEKNKMLRVIVDGGGCSGFQYKFELDDKITDDDIVFGNDQQKIVIDSISLDYCAGATVDYQIELIKSGFRIVNNPKAEQGCSCGASFALKLD